MKKLIFIAIFTAITYACIYSWALLRVPQFVTECTASAKDKDILENPRKLSNIEQAKFASKTWACVKSKQGWIEKLFVELPK